MSPRVSAALREQYLENRRDQILDAALRVFGEKGFFDANVADIAREANIGKGTIYLYFHCKEEIFTSVLLERSFIPLMAESLLDLDAPIDVVFQHLAKNYLTFVGQKLAFFHLVIADLQRFPDHSGQVYIEMVLRGIRLLEEYLTRQMDRGRIRKIDQPGLTAQAFMSMLSYYFINQDFLGGKQISPISQDQWAQEVVAIICARLQPV